MKRRSAFSLFNATLSLLMATTLYGMGCTAEPNELAADQDDSRIGTAEQYSGGVGGDPGTHNHFRPKCFWDHGFQQTARDLALQPLTNSNKELPSMPFLPDPTDGTECRQEALEILVGCALGEGEFAVDPEDGMRYEGELGFAADWDDGVFDSEDKFRMTGCMIERLNAFGIEMSILIYSEDLLPDQDTLYKYPVTESQAWGNLFDSTVPLNPTHDPNLPTDPAFNAFVCRDPGLFECNVADRIYTSGRICEDGATNCGLHIMGTADCNFNPDPAWKYRMFARTPDDSFCDHR